MIDPKIADYINANRRRYTDQAIRQQLIDAGYSPADIEATWAALEVPDADATIGPRFWRYFWIWVGATYALAFLGVTLATGMLTTGAAYGTFAAAVLGIALVVALLISWRIVAAVRPTRMSPAVAAAIGGGVPLLFLFLVAGSCYAMVASVGPPPPPPATGVMDLEIDPPLSFNGSGPAFCQSHGDTTGFSVYSEQLGTIDGQGVNASLDVFAPDDGGEAPIPGPGAPAHNLFINLFPTSGAGQYFGYGPGPGSQIEVDASPDGLTGTVEFTALPAFPVEERPGEVIEAEPVSGRLTWNCE